MMGFDIAHAVDPVLFARSCGITPDNWQAKLLRDQPPRALLCCSRQSGKTTVAGLMGLHRALYEAGSLVLVVSPSQRQSAEVFRTMLNFYHKLEGAPALSAESVLRAEFSNGSRIVALPGSERTVRGYAAASLIILDEAARIDDELIAAVRPMMATSNGKFIALSTPAGRLGFFYEAWVGTEDWHRVSISAKECPRISEEFLAEELRSLGPSKFSQEYNLEFVETAEAMFPSAVIDGAFSEEIAPLWN